MSAAEAVAIAEANAQAAPATGKRVNSAALGERERRGCADVRAWSISARADASIVRRPRSRRERLVLIAR